MASAIRVITFPHDDAEFEQLVLDTVAALNGHAGTSQAAVLEVLSQLLPRYPNLRIAEQSRLAALGTDDATWYVYRDGGVAVMAD
jgi:hypothetical protein